jgi:hypothetical protein
MTPDPGFEITQELPPADCYGIPYVEGLMDSTGVFARPEQDFHEIIDKEEPGIYIATVDTQHEAGS